MIIIFNSYFINRFIISLATTFSLEQAFEDASIEVKGEEKEVLDGVAHLSIQDRIQYMSLYFESDIYQMFLYVIKLYQEEGGNLLDISSPLLNEAASNEEKTNALETQEKKSIIQFASLWFLSTLILCFLRFGLSGFYDSLSKNTAYVLTSGAYFLIAIFSFCLYARESTGVKFFERKERLYEKEKRR